MNISKPSLAIAIVLLFCLSTTQQQDSDYDHDHDVSHWAKSRQKRFLVFPVQGVHKFIVSLALTIDLQDKRAWRSLSGAWNLQWQHSLPLTPLYWWNSTYFPAQGRSAFGDMEPSPTDPIDLSATFLYALIENYMNNKGMNGRECLQRAICQNAQVNYVGGVLDHIYKRLLTPERLMEDHYKDAFAMGSNGVDCYRTYHGCPRGTSVFDQFVQIDDVKE